jgi:hypothetical protein
MKARIGRVECGKCLKHDLSNSIEGPYIIFNLTPGAYCEDIIIRAGAITMMRRRELD